MTHKQINTMGRLRHKAQAGKSSRLENEELNRLHALHMKTLKPSLAIDTAKAIIKDYRRDEHELDIL